MTAKEWLNIVVDDGRLMFYMEGLVKETGHKFAFQEGPRIDKPDLAVTASTPTPSTKNPFEVTVTFENPTAIEITDCVFTIEGVGMDKIKAVKVPNVGPKQSVSAKITLIPRLPGNRRIAAGFDSKQITDVVGFLDLVIKKGKAPESGDDDKDDEDFTYSNVPVLRVEEVDLNVVENGKDHHTSDYAHNWKKDTLVIRRGEPFEVDVTFNRPYDRTTDRISLRLQTGRHPKKSEENDKRLVIAKDLSKVDWGYQRTNANSDGSKCKFRIKTAPDACVSEWKLIIRTKLPKAAPGLKDMAKHDTSTIFVLFNAWCKEDQVFLDDEDKRVEYVQNQTGRIFKNNKRPARKWWFDQCEEISLNTAMMLLNRCGSRFSSRGNATRVSRDISQMCNNNDNDDGILIGNWTGEYGDGTKPTQWARSKNIFKQWWKNNHKGVKYGQCWVFSAIVTSICRSLGIPARSVTNFGSAHDTDLSLTIDKYFYEDGTPANYSGDSVWNFHVWNEAWFRRLDLPDRFNGWQAFDSTPQEQSGGRMRCGPASVNAIYDGDLQHPYDARFIFAEINSDRVYWTIKADGSKVVDKVRKGSIGYQLATKAVGRNTREDIKGNYKCEEGSEAKRRQVAMTAMKHSADEAVQEWYKKGSGKKEEVTSLIQYQAPENGDVEVTMELENTGSKNRTVKAYLIAVATYNNGFVGDKIKAQNEDVQLAAGEKKTVRIGIKATEWLNTVKSDGLLTVHCGFKVDGTGETDFDAITIDLEKPELEVTVSNKRPKLKQDVTVTVVFTNPLDLELTNCTMTLDGDGIDLTEKQLKQKIPPHGKIKETFTIIPTQTRGQDILATFDSDQLTSIDGSATISPVV
ncbi:protein-glutamine gamma-glutamyltransferase K-like [Lineus longissimus]|uniref:protein-glutamine gamma-glutamyltransferase K-like n=1 Tax=Lineus longissimus TaxID=88925 RepID=UPI00315DC150